MHSIRILRSMVAMCIALLSGCVTMQPTRFISSVDSLAQADAAAKKRYVLVPGNKNVEAADLQFQEFAAYIDKALTDKGFVKTATFQEANVLVFLTYAIGDPQTHQYSYSLPTWGQTGVASSRTHGTVSSYGNMGTYSGTTTYTPTYGVTGSTAHDGSYTTYTRFLLLDAYDVSTYIKEKKMNQVWKTSVISIGSSNDLRVVVPYMVTAMKPHLGTNTGRKVEVEVREDDPEVQLLRGSPASATK